MRKIWKNKGAPQKKKTNMRQIMEYQMLCLERHLTVYAICSDYFFLHSDILICKRDIRDGKSEHFSVTLLAGQK